MFTIFVYQKNTFKVSMLNVNCANKAAELANTLFLTLENVVVEIENKNGEVIQKLRKIS